MFGIIYALLFGVAATRNTCYDINEKKIAKSRNKKTYYDAHGVERHVLTNHRVMTTHDFEKGTYILKDIDTGRTIETLCYDWETENKMRQQQKRLKEQEEDKRNKEEAIKNGKISYAGYCYYFDGTREKYGFCKKRTSDDLPIKESELYGFFMCDARTQLVLYCYHPRGTTKYNIQNAIKHNKRILEYDDEWCKTFFEMTNAELQEYAKKIKVPLTEEELELCRED